MGKHISVLVPANEIAPTDQVSRASATMGVQGHDCSGRDYRIDTAPTYQTTTRSGCCASASKVFIRGKCGLIVEQLQSVT